MGEVFSSAISCLQEADRTLPFIQAMLPMLQAGIAMHHSGALRLLRLLRPPLRLLRLLRCPSPRGPPCSAAVLPERALALEWRSRPRAGWDGSGGQCSAARGLGVLPPQACHAGSRKRLSPPLVGFVMGLLHPQAPLRPPAAGLLPILKELVEILFQEGFIKVGADLALTGG